MIAKAYAVHILKGVFTEDLKMVAHLGYPEMSGYCREYLAGYRSSPDILWRLDIDLARHTLHEMRREHNDEYLIIKLKFRDGAAAGRNQLNAAIRVFRRQFEAAKELHEWPMQAI